MRKVLLAVLGVGVVLAGVVLSGALDAAPPYVAGKRVAPPPVEGVSHTEQRFAAADGVKLFSQSWRPASEPRGVLVIVHGLKDYSDRYAELATFLARRGYAVHAMDLRGHGDSEGNRVWVERFTDYLDDLDFFLGRVRTAEPNRKLFLFGHSMGGAIVTLYTLTHEPKPAGLITSGGALKIEEPAAVTAPLKLIGAVAPKLGVFELKDENFSRDPKVVASMASDKLIFDGKAPARTAAELIAAVGTIREKSNTLDLPLLTLHGSADKVTPPAGSKELVAAAKGSDKTFTSYEGLVHDLVHEPEKQKVFDDVAAWLDQHTAAAP